MRIRRARPDDLDAAAMLWVERMALLRETASGFSLAPDAADRWRQRAKRWINHADVAFFIAEADAQVVGLAVVTKRESTPGLSPERFGVMLQLAVDLHKPHSGLIGRLIEAAKAWLLSCDIRVLTVNAPAGYPVEDAFWRAQGARLSALEYRLNL